MSSYIINFTNTSSETGSIISDAGFNYTDRLNNINEANIKITGSSPIKRSLIEIGSQVKIYRNGTLEFHGLVNSVDYLEGGGMSINAQGYEIWMAKENGDYASSPWSSTASATIFNSVIGESNYFTAGTVEAGTNIDFRSEVTESLWNAINNLRTKTTQDIGIDYVNTEIDILDHKGSSTSVMTLNAGIQMKDIRVSQSYPIGNDVRVYGRSEGETRIKSNSATSGQDASSKSTYGTIRKIVRDPSITTQAEANILADAMVAIYKDPVKVYDFDVINPNQSLVSGDVVTLNSQTQDLTNENVRIVGIERGIRGGNEYLTLEVTNEAYSSLMKNKNQVIAEIEKNARDNQTYDQYGPEYSSRNSNTCIGGVIEACGTHLDMHGYCLINTPAILGSGDLCLWSCSGCDIHILPINGDLKLCGCSVCIVPNDGIVVINNLYCLPTIDGSAGEYVCTNGTGTLGWGAGAGSSIWADGANPYIVPCNACGLCFSTCSMMGDVLPVVGDSCSVGRLTNIWGCSYVRCGFNFRKLIIPVGVNCY